MIDWNKPIQTKSGLKAEIHKKNIVIITDIDGNTYFDEYKEDGIPVFNYKTDKYDLINIPESKPKLLWNGEEITKENAERIMQEINYEILKDESNKSKPKREGWIILKKLEYQDNFILACCAKIYNQKEEAEAFMDKDEKTIQLPEGWDE